MFNTLYFELIISIHYLYVGMLSICYFNELGKLHAKRGSERTEPKKYEVALSPVRLSCGHLNTTMAQSTFQSCIGC